MTTRRAEPRLRRHPGARAPLRDHASNRSTGIAREAVKKWAVRTLVIASVGWTIYNWSGLVEVKNQVGQVWWFAALLVACEVAFVLGGVLMLFGAGASVRGAAGWVRVVRDARRNTRLVAEQISGSRSFLVGFNLNWLGAISTGVVLAAAVVTMLPVTAWGLLVLPLLDIVASIGWRLPVDRRLKQLRRGLAQ